MPRATRSNSDETHSKGRASPGAFARSQSLDASTVDDVDFPGRKNSFHVRPTVFCRQSSLISKTEEGEEEEKPKFIQNTRQLLILIGMALMEFSGTCGMSVIAPFFPNEVNTFFSTIGLKDQHPNDEIKCLVLPSQVKCYQS